jgi:hypothetical protein
VDGASLKLKTLTVANQLPSKQGPPVSAMPGAVLVQAIVTVEISPGRDPKTVYCEFSLAHPDGREWRRASSIEYELAGPDGITCRGRYDKPAREGMPFDVNVAFLVPAAVASDLRFRIALSKELVEFRRR